MPTRRVLLPIALLAVAVRVVLFLQLGADAAQDAPHSDAEIYHEWAATWARGEAYEPGEAFWRSPGYPAFLSVAYRILGPEPRRAVILQQVLGLATVLLAAGFLARGKSGAATAWIAALALTLHGPVVFFETQLLPVTLATFLFTAGTIALARSCGERKGGSAAGRDPGADAGRGSGEDGPGHGACRGEAARVPAVRR